jgi:hypothetical protein
MIPAFIQMVWPHSAVFGITLVVDIFWAKYNMNSADRNAGKAAFWSAMIVLAGTMSTQIWLSNHWVVIDGVLGAFVGTYWAVHNDKKKQLSKSTASEDAQLLVEEGHA